MLLLTACAAPDTPPPAAEGPAVYYNDYLGLSISVPADWHINDIGSNLSVEKGQTATPSLIEYAAGGGRLELIDLQNTEKSACPEHCRFYAYAEIFSKPVAVEQYTDLLVNLLQGAEDGRDYNLEKRQELPLARHTAQHICLRVDTNGQKPAYNEEYFIVPLKTAFVIFYISYWPQNAASQAAALTMLDNIVLPPPLPKNYPPACLSSFYML
jgi:hypothetical protein